MSYNVIPNECPKDKIDAIVERNRQKGSGLFRKAPEEKLTYLAPILWPTQHFEVGYKRLEGALNKTANYYKKRLFMLGKVSMPYLEKVFFEVHARKALGIAFSKENRKTLAKLSKFDNVMPVIPTLEPKSVYKRFQQLFVQEKKKLNAMVKRTKEAVKPLFKQAKDYERRSENAKENAAVLAYDKSNPQYSEYMKIANQYASKANELRNQANRKVDAQISKLDRFIRNWNWGKRRHLKLKPGSTIEEITTLGTFYHFYWVARFESVENIRYLVLNTKGRQEKDIQAMLHFDPNLREEIDSCLDASLPKKNRFGCFYCGKPLEKSATTCTGCKKDVLKCAVCKLPISKDDPLAECPLCQRQSHRVHLQEWIKSQGKCPHCLQNVRVDQLVFK